MCFSAFYPRLELAFQTCYCYFLRVSVPRRSVVLFSNASSPRFRSLLPPCKPLNSPLGFPACAHIDPSIGAQNKQHGGKRAAAPVATGGGGPFPERSGHGLASTLPRAGPRWCKDAPQKVTQDAPQKAPKGPAGGWRARLSFLNAIFLNAMGGCIHGPRRLAGN